MLGAAGDLVNRLGYNNTIYISSAFSQPESDLYIF